MKSGNLMKKDSKIFVAGSAGLVGSAVTRKLLAEGYTNLLLPSIEELDLRRQNEVEEYFEKNRPEFVFLCAAKVGGIMANNTYKAEFIYDNLSIAMNVIHCSYKYKAQKLLNLGSSCIYPKNAPQPLKEEYLLTGLLEETNEPYAIAKIAAIKLCNSYNFQYKTNYISLMPTNLYGLNDNYNLETSHVLPAIVRKMVLAKAVHEDNYDLIRRNLRHSKLGWGLVYTDQMSDKDIDELLMKIGINKSSLSLWGSGKVYREFMHSDDLASACLFFMNNIDSHQVPQGFANIGTGTDITIAELANIIAQKIDYKGLINFDASKPDGTYKKLMDVSMANSLNWKATLDINSGVDKVINEYLVSF